jgi:hypothetical protein
MIAALINEMSTIRSFADQPTADELAELSVCPRIEAVVIAVLVQDLLPLYSSLPGEIRGAFGHRDWRALADALKEMEVGKRYNLAR